jgi:hypothetical protein
VISILFFFASFLPENVGGWVRSVLDLQLIMPINRQSPTTQRRFSYTPSLDPRQPQSGGRKKVDRDERSEGAAKWSHGPCHANLGRGFPLPRRAVFAWPLYGRNRCDAKESPSASTVRLGGPVDGFLFFLLPFFFDAKCCQCQMHAMHPHAYLRYVP